MGETDHSKDCAEHKNGVTAVITTIQGIHFTTLPSCLWHFRVRFMPQFCSAPLRPATQDALDKAELEVPEIEWDLWLHKCAMSAHRADEGG